MPVPQKVINILEVVAEWGIGDDDVRHFSVVEHVPADNPKLLVPQHMLEHGRNLDAAQLIVWVTTPDDLGHVAGARAWLQNNVPLTYYETSKHTLNQ